MGRVFGRIGHHNVFLLNWKIAAMMAVIVRIFNWLEAEPSMQDWEEQRELFPTRRRVAPAPLPRRRIRPNLFARIARYSSAHASVVLVIATFIVAIAISISTFNTQFDLLKPIEITQASAAQVANQQLQLEFPSLGGLIFLKVTADTPQSAKTAAQFLAGTLEKDQGVFTDTFVPGIGPFYDRFGILYLDVGEIEARVRHTAQLRPLFQALAVSPNLAGLSTLVTQVASAVKGGRSPQGLEDLFLQLSLTVRNLAASKPRPMDWRAVAGLGIETRNVDWTVIVEPQPAKLQQARQVVEALVASTMQAQDNLKITASFPKDTATGSVGSSGRQVVVYFALAILLVNLLLAFALQNMRTIILVLMPVAVAIIIGLAAASLVTLRVDRVVVTFIFAVVLPTALASFCMATALVKPRKELSSATAISMLAAQDTGSLVLTTLGAAIVIWAAWIHVGVSSLAALGVITVVGNLAGLLAILIVVPGLFTLLPEAPVEQHVNSGRRGDIALWKKIRPLLAILGMAACMFCIVFFSSLRFTTEMAADVSRGVQFLANDEKSAQVLSNELKSIPEVGTVRWMGTFMPQSVEEKQKILQNLKGSLEVTNASGPVGPNDLGNDVQVIEAGLRTISDVAGTDVGLASSAHQLRRSLAVLFNTSDPNVPVEIELERLIFAEFAQLPARVDELAMLQRPALSDFDVNLRKQFVSDKGHWRVEALPRRIIAAGKFTAAVDHLSTPPVGPLVVAQAELAGVAALPARPLIIGLLLALVLALAYLRQFLDWLIVLASALMPLALYAALAVTSDTAIETLSIPAIVVAVAANVGMALVTVIHGRRLRVSRLKMMFPIALVLAIALPLQFVQVSELQTFSRSLVWLLIFSVLFNVVIVQQLFAWVESWKRSRSRLQEARTIT